MDIPFDDLWYPRECAEYLTDDYDDNIEAAIWRDIHAGLLPAEKREGIYTPRQKAPWEKAMATAQSIQFGTPATWEPVKEYRYLVKPIDAIKWAVDADIAINSQCREFYERVTADPKKRRKSGPREDSLCLAISALAKAYGYDPRQGKAKPGKLQSLMDNAQKGTEKTIREAIVFALNHVDSEHR